MKKIELGQAISILANLGVLAGLIFVGLQLKQDRSVAFADRLVSTSENQKYLAALLVENSDLWQRGISGEGEPLSAGETIAFQALVQAWDNELWRRWFIAARFPDISDSVNSPRWIKEAAHNLSDYPGLLVHWRRFHEGISRTTDNQEWAELVEEELSLIRSNSVTN